METLHFAVGLRLVRTVAVRQHPLNGDATLGEPLDGAVQDGDGSDGGFVVVDLGVGDAEWSSITVRTNA